MIRYFFAAFLLALLLATQAGQSTAAGQAQEHSWAEVALPGGLDLEAIPDGRDGERPYPKLDEALAALATAAPQERRATADASGLRLADGRVQVQIVIQPQNEAAAREAVAAAGGAVTGAMADLLQAWLPPGHLPALASRPVVDFVYAPNTAVLNEEDALAAVSEGVAAAGAAAWHEAGLRGQGVRIAIIDGGFNGYQNRLDSELPANVTVRSFVDGLSDAEVGGARDTSRHGTACAEIVHDMAPAAQLYLLKINTDIDLNEAVDYAISQGVDIISTSLTFINATPGDGSGRFATMADRARAAGILWATAAGNYRETHWSGVFADADGDGFHEFAPGVEVNAFGPGNNTAFLIPAGTALSPSIRWDDWTAVNQDYRLLLLRYNGSSYEIIASVDNPQNGSPGQRPTERLAAAASGPPAIYGVAIQRVSGQRNVHLHLLTPNRELDRRVPAMSLGNLADVAAVMTIGAVDARPPYPREDYSSEGPTNGPGGAANGGRLKPDLAAFAGVSTASYGVRAFSGTSASAPHVAGAAALVLNAYPGASPGEVQDYLQSAAVGQGQPVPNAQFGHGRLLLGALPAPIDYDHHVYVPSALSTP